MSDDNLNTKKNKIEYLATFVASVVILSIVGLIAAAAAGAVSLGLIPQEWFALIIVPIVVMSAIQTFGKDVFNTFKKYRNSK